MKIFTIKIGFIILLFLLVALGNCKQSTDEQSKAINSLENYKAKCPESECGEYKTYILPSNPKTERPSCDLCDDGCERLGSDSTWCKGCRKNCNPFPPKQGGGGGPVIPIFCFVVCVNSNPPNPPHCQEYCQ